VRLTFDRGTVVLVDEGEQLDFASLPGVRWDARVGVHRVSPHRSRALAAELRSKGVQITDETAPLVRLPGLLAFGPELRDYQEASLQLWQAAGQRGVVVLPTGSGKTHVAIGAIARTQLPTLCLVPTRVLLHQWRAALGASCGCSATRGRSRLSTYAPPT